MTSGQVDGRFSSRGPFDAYNGRVGERREVGLAKPKCTKRLIEEATALKRQGMSNKDICACIGLSETTFYGWIKDEESQMHRKFAQSLKEAEGEFKAALREQIIKHGRKEWQANAWLLERTFPEEYARPEVQLAQKAASEAAERAMERFREVVVTIRETAAEEAAPDEDRADA